MFRAMSSFLPWQSPSRSTKRRRRLSCNGKIFNFIKNFLTVRDDPNRYTKTPMGKKRAKILEGDDEDKSKEKGKKK